MLLGVRDTVKIEVLGHELEARQKGVAAVRLEGAEGSLGVSRLSRNLDSHGVGRCVRITSISSG